MKSLMCRTMSILMLLQPLAPVTAASMGWTGNPKFDIYGMTMLATANSNMTIAETLPLFYTKQEASAITAFLLKQKVNPEKVKISAAKIDGREIIYGKKHATLRRDFKIVVDGKIVGYDKAQNPAENFIRIYNEMSGKKQNKFSIMDRIFPSAAAQQPAFGTVVDLTPCLWERSMDYANGLYRSAASYFASGATATEATATTSLGTGSTVLVNEAGEAMISGVPAVATVAEATAAGAVTAMEWVAAGFAAVLTPVAAVAAAATLATVGVGYGLYEWWQRSAWDGTVTCSKTDPSKYDFNFVHEG